MMGEKLVGWVILLVVPAVAAGEPGVAERLSRAEYADFGRDEELAPLFSGEARLASWEEKKEELRGSWERLLGFSALGEEYAKGAEEIGNRRWGWWTTRADTGRAKMRCGWPTAGWASSSVSGRSGGNSETEPE